jgi:hypothetical protein
MPHSFKKALQILGVMIAVVLLFAVLAVGCASSPEARRTYNQSAMPMPRAPAFSPTTDSPITVGQPGYVEPASRLQPNPRPVRVLPEDERTRREPGIWATNPPQSTSARMVSVVTIGIPLPDDITDALSERANACKDASQKTLALKRDNYGANIARMLPDMQACWWYLSWRYCMRANIWPPSEQKEMERVIRFSDALMMGDKTATRCFAWEAAFKAQLQQVFDWHLRGWYLRDYKARAP